MKQDNWLHQQMGRFGQAVASNAISLGIFLACACGFLITWHIHNLVAEVVSRQSVGGETIALSLDGLFDGTYQFVTTLVLLMSGGILLIGKKLKRVISSLNEETTDLATDGKNMQARFGAVIGLMKDAFVISDSAGAIEFVNPSSAKLFGYSIAEMTSMNVRELLPKEEQHEHDGYIDQYKETGNARIIGKGRSKGLHGLRKDGSTFPISLLIEKVDVSDGVCFSTIIQDITNEQVMIANAKRMSAIVEHATDCIAVLGVDRRIEYINPKHEQEFGFCIDEIIGKTGNDLGRRRSNDRVYEELDATLDDGRIWAGHMLTESKDGILLEHDCTFSPISGEQGKITGFVYIGRNVTEQRELQRQLSHAQKMESIGQLAAGIAHEINTPTQYVGDNTRFLQEAYVDMNSLINLLEDLSVEESSSIPAKVIRQALKDADVGYLKEEIPRAITQSLEGVERISKIVRAMKEFSHPSQEKTPVDLNRAIESTITVASNEWKYVAEIKKDLDTDLPPVSCLPGDFNQVILNIIVNAAHAIGDVVGDAPDHKGTISVSTQRMDDWVEIRIEDSGTGMPEDVKKRIFDPFFTTKEVGRGTGQGLSIAYAVVVEKHGGTICVESDPGQGTCFTIRLPLEDPTSIDAAAEGV